MYQVLESLNKTSGVTGSMLVGSDGIVIAADMQDNYNSETIGALAASITTSVQKSLERINQVPLRQVTIEAQKGKIFLTDVGRGVLVVTTEPSVNIGLVRVEIKEAAEKIRQA